MKRFHLYNAETRVASFTHERTLLGDIFSDIEVFVPEQLPIRLRGNLTGGALHDWLDRRTIPTNRHNREAVLAAFNLKHKFDLMRYSHALSLNDAFWIEEENERLDFSAINLYDNSFDEGLGLIAFTGLPGDISGNLGTPELTTVGMLPKYWQRIGIDGIILCKGGTSGYSNAGYEPYHEAASHIIAQCADIDTIPYYLEKRNGKIVSISKLFTTKQTGLITASEYIDFKSGFTGYRSLPALFEFIEEDKIDVYPFYGMCWLDYVIENFDRHLNNWGFSVDNETQRITGLSPIWDNGMSLDYDKPYDMRKRFNFASFHYISYDFVKACELTDIFRHKTNKLLTDIRSGLLFERIYESAREHYPSEELTKRTVSFVEERCLEFLKPLKFSGNTVISKEPYK